MDQGVFLQQLKAKHSSAALGGLGLVLPPVVERNGQLDLGIPSDVKRVVKREDGRLVERILTPEEQEVVNSLVSELDRQEADHVELASACSKVIDIFEASLSRMDADQAARAQLGADPPGTLAQWSSEGPQGGTRGRQAAEQDEEEEEEEVRKRSRNNSALPKESVTVLKEWLFSHVENPYPTQSDKDLMAEQTGLSIKQINNWFINARRRHLHADKATKRAKKDDQGDVW